MTFPWPGENPVYSVKTSAQCNVAIRSIRFGVWIRIRQCKWVTSLNNPLSSKGSNTFHKWFIVYTEWWWKSKNIFRIRIHFLSPLRSTNTDRLTLWVFCLLPSATKLRQGNIFTSVCQEFCPQGGSASVHAGTHPPPGRYSPGQTPPPPGQTRPPMATSANSMHPTGMLSCYCPQWSWGKVMFLHVSVILFTGGGISVSIPGFLSGGSLSGGSLSRGGLVRGGSLTRGSVPGGLCLGVSVQGGPCPGQSLSGGGSLSWRHPRMVTSRRYASYWNAFLFFFSIRLRSHFRLMSTALKALFTTNVCVKQRMGSIETNNGVHTQRLHLAAKIKRKPKTPTLSVNSPLTLIRIRWMFLATHLV